MGQVMSDYLYVIIETYYATGEASKHSIRARPLPSQNFPTSMKVECSSKMRNSHPVGTKFKIKAKVKATNELQPCLYTSFKWEYQIVSDSEAKKFINENYG